MILNKKQMAEEGIKLHYIAPAINASGGKVEKHYDGYKEDVDTLGCRDDGIETDQLRP